LPKKQLLIKIDVPNVRGGWLRVVVFLKSIKFVFLLYVTINGNKMLVYIFTLVFSKEKSAKKVEARIENGQKKSSIFKKPKIIFEKTCFFSSCQDDAHKNILRNFCFVTENFFKNIKK